MKKKKFLIEFSILPVVASFFLVHSRDVQHFLKVCYLLGILRKVFEFYRKERRAFIDQKVLGSNALKVIYKSTSAILHTTISQLEETFENWCLEVAYLAYTNGSG